MQTKRTNIFYLFELSTSRHPEARCIWSRAGCHTWKQAFDRVCQYGQYFRSLGCGPGSKVGVYLMNSPEFVFVWFGLLSLGSIPVLLNYHIGADVLIHCARLGGFKVLLVDSEHDCQARVRNEQERLGKMEVSVVTLSEQLKAGIALSKPVRPDDHLRELDCGKQTVAFFYTRYDVPIS